MMSKLFKLGIFTLIFISFFGAFFNFSLSRSLDVTGAITVSNIDKNTGASVYACWTLVRKSDDAKWTGQCATSYTYTGFPVDTYTIIVDQKGTDYTFYDVIPADWQTNNSSITWTVRWVPKSTSTPMPTPTPSTSLGPTVSPSATPTPTPVSQPSDKLPLGYLDVADCDTIGGWALDMDTPDSSIVVHIYYDGPSGRGSGPTSIATDVLRDDVNSSYGVSGTHGWHLSTPTSLKDGKTHSVYVYAINNNSSGRNPLLSDSPKYFKCVGTTTSAPTLNPTSTPPPAGGPTSTPKGDIKIVNREVGTGKLIYACWTLIRITSPVNRWEGQCATSYIYTDFIPGTYTIEVDQKGTTHTFSSVDPVDYQNLLGNDSIEYVVWWSPNSTNIPAPTPSTSSGPTPTTSSSPTPTPTPSNVPIPPTPSPSSTPTPNTRASTGYLDVANCEVVGGWAYDPDNETQPIFVDIYSDGISSNLGNLVERVITTGRRFDVNAFLGIIGTHGFTIITPASLKDGRKHTISVYAKEEVVGGLEGYPLNGSPKAINCNPDGTQPAVPIRPTPGPGSSPVAQPPSGPDKILGYLDVATCEIIAGWAVNYNDPNSPVQIELLQDGSFKNGGRLVRFSPTDYVRPDVNRALGVSGSHGFIWQTPDSLKDGLLHELFVYGADLDNNYFKLKNTPKKIKCFRAD